MIFDPYPLPSANLANFLPLPPKERQNLKWLVPFVNLKSQVVEHVV